MWSDEEIDRAFQALDSPPDQPLPLAGWLQLENQLDADATAALVRQRVRQRVRSIIGLEVTVLLLAVLGWLLWPAAAADKLGAVDERMATATGSRAALVAASPLAPATGQGAHVVPAPTGPVVKNFNTSTADFQNPTRNQAAPISQAGTIAGQPAQAANLPIELPVRGTAPSDSTVRTHRNFRVEIAAALVTRKAPNHALAHQASDLGTRPQQPGRVQYSAASGRAATTAASAESGKVAAAKAFRPALQNLPQQPLQPATLDAESQAATSRPGSIAEFVAAPVVLQLPLAPALPTHLNAGPAGLPTVVLPAAPQQSRVFVGLLVAPDVSTVRFADMQSPRPNAALLLEYRFRPRWRLSSGLQRADRHYAARKADYDWTQYPKAQTRDFGWVNGSCTILDVPVNLRYDAWVRPQHRLFVSTGLSTFFLPKEDYSYNYLETNNQPAVWERSYANENRCLFGILNLSAGYERQLGQHWSLQAEPYVKLPLTGVGEGKVRLASGGVFFGLKYGL